MTLRDLSEAKNPDLRASHKALIRAAEVARQIAIQTDTAIIIEQNGQPVRITAQQLRAQRKEKQIP